MNVNYVGSFAERKMKFASSVSVEAVEKSDLFNAISIYMPSSFTDDNLVNFDKSVLAADKPAVLAVTVDNYGDVLKGDILDQWLPIFRQDTNFDVVLYIVVFLNDASTSGLWTIGSKSIVFAPLANAFKKLYFISYIKSLFDPSYDGSDIVSTGTFTKMTFNINNPTASPVTLVAGTYTFMDGVKSQSFTIAADQVLPASGGLFGPVTSTQTTVGLSGGVVLPAGSVLGSAVTPVLTGLTLSILTVSAGTVAGTTTSRYFDTALALAYQCKLNTKLSAFFSLARVDLTKISGAGVDTNKCFIRSKTLAQEEAALTNFLTGDRSKYFWGALHLMLAENTTLFVDCEDRNLTAYVLAGWFASKNASYEYVGNKLSLLRLSSLKCFGLPSPLNTALNGNDSDGFDIFDEKNAGYLASISGSNTGDSYLSMCRGITGIPITALMISKYVDYKSAQDCADMITEKGTLVNPILTNDEAYQKIQNTVSGNLLLFVPTKRITGIVMKFPPFAKAKVGLTALEASSAWGAMYVDDLDSISIGGGITAQ